MNVSLTRGKKALYILCHVESLKVHVGRMCDFVFIDFLNFCLDPFSFFFSFLIDPFFFFFFPSNRYLQTGVP